MLLYVCYKLVYGSMENWRGRCVLVGSISLLMVVCSKVELQILGQNLTKLKDDQNTKNKGCFEL